MAILGFMGELHSLDATERARVTREFITTTGTAPVRTLAGVSDAAQFDFYSAVAKSVEIPVVIHDFPASFATELSPELVVQMAREGVCRCIKMGEPPVAQKVTRVLELSEGATRIFGGLAGVYFIEELRAARSAR